MAFWITRPIKQFVRQSRDLLEGDTDLTQRIVVHSRDETADLAENINQVFARRARAGHRRADRGVPGRRVERRDQRGVASRCSAGSRTRRSRSSSSTAAVTELSASIQQVADERRAGHRRRRAVQRRGRLRGAAHGADPRRRSTTPPRRCASSARARSGSATSSRSSARSASRPRCWRSTPSIEAAHAGEQGRGFAVVADEVSSLARRVGQSAKDIEALIQTIKEQTAAAVASMEHRHRARSSSGIAAGDRHADRPRPADHGGQGHRARGAGAGGGLRRDRAQHGRGAAHRERGAAPARRSRWCRASACTSWRSSSRSRSAASTSTARAGSRRRARRRPAPPARERRARCRARSARPQRPRRRAPRRDPVSALTRPDMASRGTRRRARARLHEHAGLELPAWVVESRGAARIERARRSTPEAYLELVASARGAAELRRAGRGGARRRDPLLPPPPADRRAASTWSCPRCARARPAQPVRVWSAGCASGEEPYTLAMVLAARACPAAAGVDRRHRRQRGRARGRARAARYPRGGARRRARGVARRLRRRRATRSACGPSIARWSRSSAQNLVRRASRRAGCDLVWCRNVLIYFARRRARRAVVERLVGALEPGGFLFVGYSETLRDVPEPRGACAPATPCCYVRRAARRRAARGALAQPAGASTPQLRALGAQAQNTPSPPARSPSRPEQSTPQLRALGAQARRSSNPGAPPPQPAFKPAATRPSTPPPAGPRLRGPAGPEAAAGARASMLAGPEAGRGPRRHAPDHDRAARGPRRHAPAGPEAARGPRRHAPARPRRRAHAGCALPRSSRARRAESARSRARGLRRLTIDLDGADFSPTRSRRSCGGPRAAAERRRRRARSCAPPAPGTAALAAPPRPRRRRRVTPPSEPSGVELWNRFVARGASATSRRARRRLAAAAPTAPPRAAPALGHVAFRARPVEPAGRRRRGRPARARDRARRSIASRRRARRAPAGRRSRAGAARRCAQAFDQLANPDKSGARVEGLPLRRARARARRAGASRAVAADGAGAPPAADAPPRAAARPADRGADRRAGAGAPALRLGAHRRRRHDRAVLRRGRRSALEALAGKLVEIERRPGDAELLRDVFRDLHTVKGSSAMVGLAPVNQLAHAAEDLVGQIRDAGRAADGPVVDALLAALDAPARDARRRPARRAPITVDPAPVVARLRNPGAARRRSTSPRRRRAAAARPPPRPPPPRRRARAPRRDAPTIRVDFDKLDRLLNLVGELVLGRDGLRGAVGVAGVGRPASSRPTARVARRVAARAARRDAPRRAAPRTASTTSARSCRASSACSATSPSELDHGDRSPRRDLRRAARAGDAAAHGPGRRRLPQARAHRARPRPRTSASARASSSPARTPSSTSCWSRRSTSR